jgi:hypothetical protein
MPLEGRGPFKQSDGGKKASDSNRAFKDPPTRIPQRLGGAGDYDLIAIADALGVTTIAAQAPDMAGPWDASAATGSRFTDDTTDVGDAGTADFLFFPATEEDEEDFFLFGSLTPFFGAEIVMSTDGVDGAVAWEYCRAPGSDGLGLWTTMPFTFDGSGGLQTDAKLMIFAVPEDWSAVALPVEVDAVPRFYIRARVTTVYSTNPIGTSMKAIEMDATHVTNGYIAKTTGVVKSIMVEATTAGGGNNDTVLQLINHTKQKRGYYASDNSAKIVEFTATKACYVEVGDILSLCVLQEDGTTELQTVDTELMITL